MVFEKVKSIIVSELKVAEEKITLQASLADDLGADSLDAVEVIMSIENVFDIEINDEVAQSLKTIGEVVSYIEEQIK